MGSTCYVEKLQNRAYRILSRKVTIHFGTKIFGTKKQGTIKIGAKKFHSVHVGYNQILLDFCWKVVFVTDRPLVLGVSRLDQI